MSAPDVRTSIIIPVYNEPEGLETTVQSLLHQTAKQYEIIIVDNGSVDQTPQVAEHLTQNNNVTHLVEDEIQGSYAARNAGIETAAGEVIGFLDADMWVGPNYVESITRLIQREDRMYMGCDVEIVAGDSSIGRFNQAIGLPVRRYIEDLQFAPTCSLVVKKGLFEAVGDFDDRLISGGDLEFGQRVAEAGYELVFEPEVVLCHPARRTIRELILKHIRVGRGQEQLQRQYPARFDLRHPLHPSSLRPLSPSEFERRLQVEPHTRAEKVYWYVLSWLLELSKVVGRIREKYWE